MNKKFSKAMATLNQFRKKLSSVYKFPFKLAPATKTNRQVGSSRMPSLSNLPSRTSSGDGPVGVTKPVAVDEKQVALPSTRFTKKLSEIVTSNLGIAVHGLPG